MLFNLIFSAYYFVFVFSSFRGLAARQSLGALVENFKKTARAICKLADVKKEDISLRFRVRETERLFIIAAKEFGAKGVGVEIDFSRVICFKNNFKSKRIIEIK